METVGELKRMSATEIPSHEGRYLTFTLGGEEYGIEILKVREIIRMMNITSIPQTPGYVKGVMNLRGKVIPVIDLRLKFGFEGVMYTEKTCIIVAEMKNMLTGVVVDAVSEVIDVKGEDLEPSPHFENGVNTDILLGMAKMKDKVKLLLDIDRVLGAEEICTIENPSESPFNKGEF